MSETRGVTFTERDTVATDGITFIECKFTGANLVFSGGEPPRFDRCHFSRASWEFAGAALRTVRLLQAINAAPGGGGFVADLLTPVADQPSAWRSF